MPRKLKPLPKPENHPHQELKRKLSRVILHVPETDWAEVMVGQKTMFRSYSRRPSAPPIMPTPCVAWRRRGRLDFETKPLMMLETWREPLGSITPADLEEEGFETLDDFKRYFDVRYPPYGYRPLANVDVYRVRPITPADVAEYAVKVMEWMGYSL